ncbi:MAG: low temperature requirement protein A [Solirubrobacteraceae bacterium]
MGDQPARDGHASKVSTLELFFDLVFVFTITQLTRVLARDPDGPGLLRATVLLVVIWWMYGGYAWLTNVVAPDRIAQQLLLLGGMAGFFVISLAVPSAFGAGGVAFGVGYLIVVLVHAGLFTRSAVGESSVAILKVAPLNLAAASMIVAAGIVDGGWGTALLWGLAVAVILLPSLRAPDARFELAPRHFVERHGLVVIVAIGESVVAVGTGASTHPLSAGLLASAVIGLSLSACLWWSYFGQGEDERALEAMSAAPAERRPWLALNAYYHWHLAILLGIVAAASALQRAIGAPGDPLSLGRSLSLGGGVALFLVGGTLYRSVLGLGVSRWRIAAAALSLTTIPLGTQVSAFTQLGGLLTVLLACLVSERLRVRQDQTAMG